LEPDRATAELCFQTQLDDYAQATREQSFVRFHLIQGDSPRQASFSMNVLSPSAFECLQKLLLGDSPKFAETIDGNAICEYFAPTLREQQRNSNERGCAMKINDLRKAERIVTRIKDARAMIATLKKMETAASNTDAVMLSFGWGFDGDNYQGYFWANAKEAEFTALTNAVKEMACRSIIEWEHQLSLIGVELDDA
jgi:hypothetical protein